MNFPARRTAIYLALVAVIGVPITLYVTSYPYNPDTAACLVAGGLLAALLLGFTVFVARVGNNIPDSFVKKCRVGAAIIAAAILSTMAFGAQGVSRSIAEEAAAVSNSYTSWISTDDCRPANHAAPANDVQIHLSEDGTVCSLAIPVDKYSAVIYPDGTNITLSNMAKTDGAGWLAVAVPSKGKLNVFLYSFRDGSDAKPLAGTGLDLTAQHFTRINSRFSA